MSSGMRCTSIPKVQVSLRSAQDSCEGSKVYLSTARKGIDAATEGRTESIRESQSGFYMLRVTQKESYEYDIERFYPYE
jgi:hypothetical protein